VNVANAEGFDVPTPKPRCRSQQDPPAQGGVAHRRWICKPNDLSSAAPPADGPRKL